MLKKKKANYNSEKYHWSKMPDGTVILLEKDDHFFSTSKNVPRGAVIESYRFDILKL
jgi:hypothetical protein